MATESDKINIGAVGTLVAVLALTMVAIVAVLTAMVRNEVDQEVERKGGRANTREYRDLAAAQRTRLTNEAQWTDRDAGVLSIPIERSMNLVVDEIRSEPELATATPDAGVADAADEDAATETDSNEGAEPEAPQPPPARRPAPVPAAPPPPATPPAPAPPANDPY